MCRTVSFNDMTAAAGTLLGVLTLALIVKVFNVIEGVLDTVFEIQFNHHHPSNLAATVLHLRVPVPKLPANIMSSVRIISPVVFVLTVSLLIAAHMLRSVSLFKRASSVPDSWIVDHKYQNMLPGAGSAHQWVRSLYIAATFLKNASKCFRRTRAVSSARVAASLRNCPESTHRQRPVVQGYLRTLVKAFCVAVLPASACAAPTNDPVEKDVTCIVTDMTLASDCPIENSKYLTPEAQGLIALGVVTVILTFILVIFGVPQWAWKWFRRLVHTSAEPVCDAETVNATAGGTIPQDHAGRLRSLFRLLPGLNLFKARGARHVPSPHTPAQSDTLVAGTGRGFDDEHIERSEMIDDNDLKLEDLNLFKACGARHVPNPHTPAQRDTLVAGTGRGFDGEHTERSEMIDDNDLKLEDMTPPAVSPPQMPQLVFGQRNLVPSVIDFEPQKHDDPKTLLGKSNTY